MSLITETSLRAELRNKKIDQYTISKTTKMTPSAIQFLKDRKIELVIEDENVTCKGKPDPIKTSDDLKASAKYVLLGTECIINEKPEYMTQLHGNKLVYKDHPRIALRGMIDSLQSQLLELQFKVSKAKIETLLNDLSEVLQYIRNILRCEVLEEDFTQSNLIGLNENELREWSHNPMKHFNMKHVLPSYEMGEITIGLNSLRSSTRQVELSAIKAFKNEEGIAREDLLRALNRLSSCFYIMMLKNINGLYK